MRKRLAVLLSSVLAACTSSGGSGSGGGSAPPPAATVPAQTATAVAAGLVPLATDVDGAPRLMRAVRAIPAPVGASPELAARAHLRAIAPIWRAPAGRVDEARAAAVVSLRGGASLVTMQQRIGGVEVLDGDLNVLLGVDGSLAAVRGTMVATTPARPLFTLSPADALAAAIRDRYQLAVTPAASARGLDEWSPLTVAARADLTVTEARAKPVLAPSGRSLVAAYLVELFASTGGTDGDALRFVIAGDDGRVLRREDLTARETFIYRVWADAAGDRRPFDGPHVSAAPHPTGNPDGWFPPFVPANLVAVDGLNHNPEGGRDPWLPAHATETAGNNVDAYVDYNAPDGLSATDFRAGVTSPGAFDRSYDPAAAPLVSNDQSKAAVTSLFYTINWLHDWYYDSGFTEATGNAQLDNLGRGGAAGDRIRAEAQDGALSGSRNNANMSTPSDGLAPRMQVFLWSGVNQKAVTIDGSGELAANTAAFGPLNFDLGGPVVLADDGVASASNGCEPIGNVSGAIALVDRGACSFAIKVTNAQAGGATGVIIANNAAGAAPGMAGVGPTITIPVLSISMDAATALKARLVAGPVTGRLRRVSGVEVDGALDASVVGHEWGHYLHHRLSRCGGTTQCGALSEGWADFIALHMMLRAEDDPGATFAIGPYSGRGTSDNSAYFGIRRYPYSVDRARSPLMFRHIQRSAVLPDVLPRGAGGADNAEVHNAGEIWAAMMWEAYAALLDAHPYAEARRRMSDYVVAGLLLTPTDATFTEARDGLLAAISALAPEDLERVAAAFASRGAGSCAVAPARTSTSLDGVVEGDAVAGRLALGGLRVADDQLSCDGDGYLDPGELGQLHVTVANAGPSPMTGVVVTAASTTGGIDALGSATVATLPPFSSAEVTVPVRIAVDAEVDGALALTVTATADGGCEASLSATLDGRYGVDDIAATSATDDVEVTGSVWTPDGTDNGVWARTAVGGGHALVGRDLSIESDTHLTTPPLYVSQEQPLVVTLSHRYQFEGDAQTLYDGGVIEILRSSNEVWVDATTLTSTPIAYTGALTTDGNPLGGRPAFSRQSPGWPARQALILDFGTALAGEKVQLRFRIATDSGVGAYGWELDDLVFAGIDNTPFGEVIEEGPTCQRPPVASAGADQDVLIGDLVQLDGTASGDPDGETVRFLWIQELGPPVALADPTAAAPTFIAPDVDADTVLRFRLAVGDSFATASDTVDVIVVGPAPDAGVVVAVPPDAAVVVEEPADAAVVDVPPDAAVPAPDAAVEIADAAVPVADAAAPPTPDAAPPTAGDDTTTGCGCQTGSGGGALGLLVPLGALLLALRRRR